MANQYQTMIDIAKRQGADRTVGLIEDVQTYAPEATLFPARTITGTNFKTLIRTAYPKSQFRKPNTGVDTGKSTWTNKQVECAYLDGQLNIDQSVADADDRGADALLADEETGQMKSHLINIGRQIWYGANKKFNGQQDGFVGALEVVDPNFVLDATGNDANLCSSVFFVKFGVDACQLIFGKSNTIRVGKWVQQKVTVNNQQQTAWLNSLEGWVGAQWVSKNCLSRIKNVSPGKPLTDNLAYQLLALLPVGFRPDAAFMSRRSQEYLRQSRITALLPAPPTPESIAGIPIKVTDSIADTEPVNL